MLGERGKTLVRIGRLNQTKDIVCWGQLPTVGILRDPQIMIHESPGNSSPFLIVWVYVYIFNVSIE